MQAPQTLVLNQAPNGRDKTKFSAKYVLGLSITQVILGSLAFILQICLIETGGGMNQLGHGIWTGVLFIIAGALGITASIKKSTCWIVSFLVMSIIAALFTVGLLAPAAVSWAFAWNYYDRYLRYNTNPGATVGLSATMVMIAIVEAVVAIIGSGLACQGICCVDSKKENIFVQGTVQYVQGTDGQTQVVIVPLAQGPQPATIVTQVDAPGGFQIATAPMIQPSLPTLIQVNPMSSNQMPGYPVQQPVEPPSYQLNATPTPSYLPQTKT